MYTYITHLFIHNFEPSFQSWIGVLQNLTCLNAAKMSKSLCLLLTPVILGRAFLLFPQLECT